MAKKKKERPVEEYNYEKLEKIFERISPNFEKMGKLERKIAAMGTLLAVYKVKDDVYFEVRNYRRLCSCMESKTWCHDGFCLPLFQRER